MAWVYILCADVFEIAWPFVMKSFSTVSLWRSVVISICLTVPVSLLLTIAMKAMPANTVYAAFVGIGAVGATLVGILIFHESTQALRLGSLALVIFGLVGLKFFG
jgi:quaternary ammonium compound-resistance protein SugE